MGASNMSRREFLIGSTAVAGAVAAARSQAAGGAPEGKLPAIKLGKLEVSRIVLGSNPMFGFSHTSPELDSAMREWFTDERITALLDEAAGLGVTAVVTPVYPRWMDLWARYKSAGGKMRTWIAQPDVAAEQMKGCISDAVKGGATAVWVQGQKVEDTFPLANGPVMIAGWVDHIHSLGVAAGLASHRPDVLPALQKAGVPVDFYSQCLYIPDTFRPEDREKALATIRQLRKPVLAYKVLAAGRNQPKEAFERVFRELAPKDGLCVGIFPRDNPRMLAEGIEFLRPSLR